MCVCIYIYIYIHLKEQLLFALFQKEENLLFSIQTA